MENYTAEELKTLEADNEDVIITDPETDFQDDALTEDMAEDETISDEVASLEEEDEKTEEDDCSGDIRSAILMMNDLKAYCEKKKIPMFSTIADVDGEKQTAKYISRVVTPFFVRKNIKDDKITKFNAAINGEFYLKVTAPGNSQIAEIADEFAEENA